MPSMPWIKLYTEMLDDPKLGRLHADLKWHFVALCLLAGECDAEGYLVNGMEAYTIHDIAWRLREPPAAIGASLEILQNAGLVCRDEDDTWFVTSFAKRQGRSQSEKRAQWRERKRRQREREDDATVTPEPVPINVTRDTSGSHAGVTPLDTDTDTDTEADIETDNNNAAAAVQCLLAYGMDTPEKVLGETRLLPQQVIDVVEYAQEERLGAGWVRTQLRNNTWHRPRAPDRRNKYASEGVMT